MAKQNNSSPVNCPTCGKTISRKNDLPRHMKLHMPDREEQKLPCPYKDCPFRTLQKSNLKTHLNIHTGERPYKCHMQRCQFRTGDPGSLNRHRKEMHEDQRSQGSGDDRPAGTRKATRRRRRTSPYTSSSLSLEDDYTAEGSKNISPAFGTELTVKYVPVDDMPLVFSENPSPVPSGPITPAVSEGDLYLSSFGFDSVPPVVSHISVDDNAFDAFCSGFNDWLPGAMPAVQDITDGTPLQTLTSLPPGSYSNTHMPTSLPTTLFPSVFPYTLDYSSTLGPTSFFPSVHEMTCVVKDSSVTLPGAWTLPAYEAQPLVDNTSVAHKCDTYVAAPLSGDQSDFWPPNSFATTDTTKLPSHCLSTLTRAMCTPISPLPHSTTAGRQATGS